MIIPSTVSVAFLLKNDREIDVPASNVGIRFGFKAF